MGGRGPGVGGHSEPGVAKVYQSNPINLDHRVAHIETAVEAIVTISDDDNSMFDLKGQSNLNHQKMRDAVKTMTFKQHYHRHGAVKILDNSEQYDNGDLYDTDLPLHHLD